MMNSLLQPLVCGTLAFVCVCIPSGLMGQTANQPATVQSADYDGGTEPSPAPATGDLSASEPAQKVDIDPAADDNQISERISRILVASNWFQDVSVDVDQGIVFLNGQAENETQRAWAANMSRNVQDVVAVVNNISVADGGSFDIEKSSSHVSSSLKSLWRDFLQRLPLIVVGIIILILTWCADHAAAIIIRRSARRARLRGSLQDLLVQLSTFVTWVLGLMIAAVVVFPGMTPAKLLTVLGLGSVALGFAFKDIFENFFAGVLILWRFPFDKGDFIECNGIEGQVEDVTIRMSLIRQVDGKLVVVPNAVLFKNPVNVLTSQDLRRTTVVCGVAYGEDVDHCRDVIATAVHDCPSVAESRPVEIFATEFASSSINFEITWWTGSTPLDIRRSCDEVISRVKRALDETGIEIPFPYRTLTFKHPLELQGLPSHEQPDGDESQKPDEPSA